MKYLMAHFLLRPYISRELPAWGKVYEFGIGSYKSDPFWRDADCRLIRDKRNNLYRILDLRKWADRSFFFLRRWYDLEAALLIAHLVKPGDHVLDVGANYGHFTLAAAAAVTETGTVTSIEPNPVVYARLVTHVQLNQLSQVTTHQVGLSDQTGQLDLTIPEINSGEASFAGGIYEEMSKVSCPVLTGDNLLGGRDVQFVKIDVEGFERKVIAGLSATIHRCRPIILTEVATAHLSRAGTSWRELKELLVPLGYQGFLMGLSRRNGTQTLKLLPVTEKSFEGDVVWVTEEKIGSIKTFLDK